MRDAAYKLIAFAVLLSMPRFAAAIEPAEPGNLQIDVEVSPTPEDVEKWAPMSPGTPITLKHLRELERGKVVYIAFIITGYTLTQRSEANLEVDCKIVGPDGKVLSDLLKYAVWRRRASPRAFVMAYPALELRIDPGDPLGKYRVVATVHDRVSGRIVSTEYSLDVKQHRTTG